MSIINAANRLKDDVSLVELLARLGYDPTKRSGHETFYHSMIRDGDSTPSFTVNDKLGVWFDHGLGKGGNIIDFGLSYWPRLRFRSVVEKLTAVMDLPTEEISDLRNAVRPRPRLAVKVPHYIVFETKPIGSHPAITTYLQSRGVFESGKNFLSEIYYYAEEDNGNRKHFFSAGWKNENGGWEVRNKYFKG